MQAKLLRQATSDQGTFGVLAVSLEGTPLFRCFTGELPERGNKPRVSCIPAGSYKCKPWHSRKYPNHYTVTEVPNRSGILFHSGNFCGDVEKGLLSNVLGCILVGRKLGTIRGQQAVLSSRLAFKDLREVIGERSFELEISSGY